MLSLIIYILILAVIYWAITTLLPLAEPFATVLKVLFVILILVALIQMIGWVDFYPVRR